MKSVSDLRGELVDRDVELLDLDPHNPRLPEELNGAPQRELLRYLYENLVLDELAQSFIDNGFFMHEPLIIMPSKKGRFTVLEGNRRLAALIILHHRPEAEDLSFDIEVRKSDLARLRKIPCYEVKSRSEVYGFLGFRHIGGIKTWGAEAKARYIAREVDDAVKRGSKSPFKDVGKRVGSNTQSIRNSYIALALLRYARDEFSADVKTLQNERFGVWQRALNSPLIRDYIGFPDAREYQEIRSAVRGLKERDLKRVLSDLTPASDSKKAVVEDSRDITDYGRILSNKRAEEILSKYKDFEVARQAVDIEELPKRLERIKRECEVLLQELQNAKASDELLEAAKNLQ